MPDFKQFPLPDTAEGLTEAEILNWRVQPGDEVQVNQIVIEIETAKAAVELPCPWAGVITELLVEPGQTVEVGTPILTVDVDPGGTGTPAPIAGSSSTESSATGSPDAGSPNAGSPNAGSANAGSTSAGSAQPASVNGTAPAQEAAEDEMKPLVGYGSRAASSKRRPRKGAVKATLPATDAPDVPLGSRAGEVPGRAEVPGGAEATGAGAAGRETVPLAKPPVRKLAKELGVDLREVPASGEGGVITREDVRHAANGTAVAAPAGAVSAGDRETRVPIRGVRKATAQAMVHSAFSAPHVTEFLTVDVTPMMEFRAKLKDSPAFAGVKLTPLAFAAKAMCLAVRRTPDVNAVWDEDAGEIVYKDYVHLGVAAATPRGLVVPKVRDAGELSLVELAGALNELTETARQGKTPPADMLNGTITITNVGVFGVDTGTPIINPGESAILAFGAIRDMPWVVDGQIVPRKVCQLSLSFDHRVVDGEQGSRFLADVGALLADPATAITY